MAKLQGKIALVTGGSSDIGFAMREGFVLLRVCECRWEQPQLFAEEVRAAFRSLR